MLLMGNNNLFISKYQNKQANKYKDSSLNLQALQYGRYAIWLHRNKKTESVQSLAAGYDRRGSRD